VSVSYGLEGQPGQTTSAPVAPHSRFTFDVNNSSQAGPGQTGVSAAVVSTNAVPILVERPFYFKRDFTGAGYAIDGSHVAPGSVPATKLFFAEGNVLDGWDEFLTLFNPAAGSATVTVTYLLEQAPPQTRTYVVPAMSRKTVQVYTNAPDQGVGREATSALSKGVSLQVTSSPGIVAERPMYLRANVVPRGRTVDDGHDAVGATTPQVCAAFAVAFGYLGDIFDRSFITLANPEITPSTVGINLFDRGNQYAKAVTISPQSRLTVDLATILPPGSNTITYGVEVRGSAVDHSLFLAELPMYADLGIGLNIDAAVLEATPC
jgi:hypothetical protein